MSETALPEAAVPATSFASDPVSRRSSGASRLSWRQIVIDCTDARELAEFYRELLGWEYLPGDEPPPPDEPDPNGADWLVLGHHGHRLAFQQVPELRPATWPEGPRPQQMHLDLSVPSVEALEDEHARVLAIGGRLLQDRSEDPGEALYVYIDPAGHPFCLFVLP